MPSRRKVKRKALPITSSVEVAASSSGTNRNKRRGSPLGRLSRPIFVVIPFAGFTVRKSGRPHRLSDAEIAAVTADSLLFPLSLNRAQLHRALFNKFMLCKSDYQKLEEKTQPSVPTSFWDAYVTMRDQQEDDSKQQWRGDTEQYRCGSDEMNCMVIGFDRPDDGNALVKQVLFYSPSDVTVHVSDTAAIRDLCCTPVRSCSDRCRCMTQPYTSMSDRLRATCWASLCTTASSRGPDHFRTREKLTKRRTKRIHGIRRSASTTAVKASTVMSTGRGCFALCRMCGPQERDCRRIRETNVQPAAGMTHRQTAT
jgi:hypothetical protein